MTFELKEGDGYLNQDNENPEKILGVLQITQRYEKRRNYQPHRIYKYQGRWQSCSSFGGEKA